MTLVISMNGIISMASEPMKVLHEEEGFQKELWRYVHPDQPHFDIPLLQVTRWEI